MGVRFPSVFTTTLQNGLPASPAETVVLTTPALSPALDNAAIMIFWYFTCLLAASCTGIIANIRRGTTTAGALLTDGLISLTPVNSGAVIVSGCWADIPGVIAGQQYSLTIQQLAAAGAGVAHDFCMIAFAL